jgi:hypothetical protein
MTMIASRRRFNALPRAAVRSAGLLVAALCLIGSPIPMARAAVDAIGEVSFLIGVARIAAGPESPKPLTKGASLQVGQVLETGDNGHIHIRFVDGAFAAVRPNTRLRIEDYHYDLANPAASRVKFSLESGTMRSITGRAGEAAKDRFRLNTPIAAIGIKGTDFVAQVIGADTTRVSVSSGAVVVAPLGEGCLAAALGPCAVANARELAANGVGRYLELSTRHPLPEIIQIDQGPNAPNRLSPPRPEEGRARVPERRAETVSPVSEVVPVTAQAAAVSSLPPPAVPVTPVVPPPVVLPPGPIVPQIWWGRWEGYADPTQPGSSYADQLAADREFAAGRGIFGMQRALVPDPVYPTSGQVAFALARSEAYVVQGVTLSPATLSGGRLDLNFDSRTFSTQLSALIPGSPALSLASQGWIERDGRFYSDPAVAMSLAGAITSRATQAGYAFTYPLDATRILNGATLWAR